MALINNNIIPDEEFIAGTTPTIEIEVRNELNLPVDLTSFTVSLKVCPLGDKTYTLLTKQGVKNSNPKTGKFSVKLLPQDTRLWDDGYYTFQAIISQSGTNEFRVEGTWLVRGAIL